MRKNLVLAVLLAGVAGAAPAVAATETFTFSGACADCFGGHGNGTGQLTLKDYSYGQNIDDTNFVSFHYDGSDLISAFDIVAGEDTFAEGAVNSAGPAAETLYLQDDFHFFHSDARGSWGLGNGSLLADYGNPHTFTAQSAVSAAPEPAAWALMIAGVGIAGTAMRRRQRTTVRYA